MEQVLLRWKDQDKALKMPIHTLRTVTHKKDNILVCMDFHEKTWQNPLVGVKLQNGGVLETYKDSINPKLQMYTKEEFNNTFLIVEGSEMEIN